MNKKDFPLILKSIINSTIFIIIICFFLRIFKLDVFSIDLDNKIINIINNFVITYKLFDFVGILFVFLYVFFILKICADNNTSRIYYIGTALIAFLSYTGKYLLFNNILFYIMYLILIILIFTSIISKKINIIKPLYLNFFIFCSLHIIFFIRDLTFSDLFNLKIGLILSIDLFMLLIILYYYMIFNPTNYKLNLNFFNIKQKYFTKITYNGFILICKYLITIIIITIIGYLNETTTECLIILTSFFITLFSFCNNFIIKSSIRFLLFIILAFYILNRITFSIGISFTIPVILGVFLAYIAFRFIVKNTKITLYRGMEEHQLRLVCINNELNSFETNLLTDFYCYKLTLKELALKYNYSKDAIWKKKKIAIKKITEDH